MITKTLFSIILLSSATLTIAGTAVKATDILDSANSAVYQANISQFRTALDLYFIDHGEYPEVSGGAGMLNALKDGNYIRENAHLDPDHFNYQVQDGGQNYSLEIN